MSKQKQVKQIKINLDEPRAIHPGVLNAYRDNGAMDLYTGDDSPAVRNEAVVFSASRVSKKPVKNVITAIYRRKLSDREVCFMHNAISCVDYFGNHVSSFRTIGRYSLPIISKVMGITPGMIKGNTDMKV